MQKNCLLYIVHILQHMIEISSKLTVRTIMKSENYIVRMQKI